MLAPTVNVNSNSLELLLAVEDPEKYFACTGVEPTIRLSSGLPVTNTASENVTLAVTIDAFFSHPSVFDVVEKNCVPAIVGDVI
jgi:hypothetical protein